MEIDTTDNSVETPSRVRRTRNIPLRYRDNEIDLDMGSNSRSTRRRITDDFEGAAADSMLNLRMNNRRRPQRRVSREIQRASALNIEVEDETRLLSSRQESNEPMIQSYDSTSINTDDMEPIRMQLDRIILNQSMLQINIRPESTAVEIFNEISNRRWFVQYYRENNSSRCMYEGRNAMNFNESNVPEHYCGSMNSVCMHCGARFFNFERNTTGIYTTCCNEGKFILPSMSKPTELMQELFLGMTQKSKLFLKHPRFYNNHLSFASITMDEDKFLSAQGIPCLRVKGSIYHNIGSIFPFENNKPKFLQVFFHGNEEDIDLRSLAENERNLLNEIRSEIRRVNPFIQVLNDILLATGAYRNPNAIQNFRITLSNESKNDHAGRYHLPTSTCVSAIMMGNEDSSVRRKREVVIHLRSKHPDKVSCLHSSYDPLAYVLTHMYGDAGWTYSKANERNEKQSGLTLLKFYCYRAHIRDTNAGKIEEDILFYGGRLMHQYWVDQWLKIEESRLDYIYLNQKKLKAESYDIIRNAVERQETDIGNWVILPATFNGSPRSNLQNFQDLLAIQRKKGKPDLFVTFTCNPNWNEIIENLNQNEKPWMRPDLTTRVYKMKLDRFINDICVKHIFGKIVAYAYVIEFQKRGLPHAHMLLWLYDEDKPKTVEDFDSIVSAEIPDPNINRKLFNIVTKHMLHGPCGLLNRNCPCMTNNQCSKQFPKQFCSETTVPQDGYPIYRRRSPENGGISFVAESGITIDNRWVVPYNPYLTLKFNAHINVEICNTVQVLKYLFKYVYKGHDKTSVALEKTINPNEIARYLEGRYVCPNESFWRILMYTMHEKYPSVERLPIHLEENQTVFFNDGDEDNIVENGPPVTKLVAYFNQVAEERMRPISNLIRGTGIDGSLNPTALDLTYAEFPTYYAWKSNERKWSRRKRDNTTLSRLYTQKPNSESFYLRMLLYCRVNMSSFKELRTVNGQEEDTYKEACISLGLLADDKEWIYLFEEMAPIQHASQLRKLFATVLVFNEVQYSLNLFVQFQQSLSEDVKYRRSMEQNNRNIDFIPSDYSESLWEINDIIQGMTNNRLSIVDFGIPFPTIARLQPQENSLDDIIYDQQEQQNKVNNNLATINDDQRQVYNVIMAAVNNVDTTNVSKLFFVDAPGGTGKTFTFNTLLASVRSLGKTAIAVASSAIAARLLEGGTTAHRRFNIPIKLSAHTICKINSKSSWGQLLLQAKIIIWDEAPMQSRWCFEAVDRSLRLLTKVDEPYGGKVVVFGGDFRQVLPVLPKGNQTAIISVILKRSELWTKMTKLKLTINERVFRCGNNPSSINFANFLLAIGENRIDIERTVGEKSIKMPNEYVFQSQNVEDFIHWCYPDFDFGSHDNINSQTAILAPTNEDVDLLNNIALDMFPGEKKVLLSGDRIKVQDSNDEISNFTEEFLNTLNPNGFPLHCTALKENCPVILLRNLNVKEGLCNGTRLVVRHISSRILICTLPGDIDNKEILIPRISLDSNEDAFPFIMTRRQFPVRLAFAMTINKAQGQTLKKVGVYLNEPVFGHGQLYVAMSRSGDPQSTKLFIKDIENKQGKFSDECGTFVCTNNVVYTEAIDL